MHRNLIGLHSDWILTMRTPLAKTAGVPNDADCFRLFYCMQTVIDEIPIFMQGLWSIVQFRLCIQTILVAMSVLFRHHKLSNIRA